MPVLLWLRAKLEGLFFYYNEPKVAHSDCDDKYYKFKHVHNFPPFFQQDCEYDSLALSSKMGSGEVRKHGLFCGSRLPPVITSEGNSLRLEFNSDNSVQKTGFAAIFFTGKWFFLLLRKPG